MKTGDRVAIKEISLASGDEELQTEAGLRYFVRRGLAAISLQLPETEIDRIIAAAKAETEIYQ